MPELPDVECFRRIMADCARDRIVERVDVADAGVLHGVSKQRLKRELEGSRFGEPWRHGKWLIAPSDGTTVILHFGMTGSLLCCSRDDPPEAHDRVILTLGNGRQLRYRDQRKLQGLRVAGSDAAVEKILASQGPDALTISRSEFNTALEGRRGRIKGVLMDQSVMAGLGNLLVDEILWRARVAPARRADGLAEHERRDVHTAMGRVLRSAVRVGCVPARRSWLTGHRDAPHPACPRCGQPLRRDRMSGRTTVWCPHCQH
ncbi:DNA-formamidopyrimidine glycosylase family protein [Streptomyces sp. NPDC004647]|uniref:Fpg/Nei family DNA glycosylase n=1 Tax=Streptomyces sp. NPDC004647 TaxID=3154671 RepID=UPI0033BA6DD3